MPVGLETYKDQNKMYGEYPYKLHIDGVIAVGLRWFHLIKQENETLIDLWPTVEQMLICHDLIEDCGVTYNDIATDYSYRVADAVYAVSNELGKNRKERNERTYPKIKGNLDPTFVKLCDRIANAMFSKYSGNGMFLKYQEEYAGFQEGIYSEKTDVLYPMWMELKRILDL